MTEHPSSVVSDSAEVMKTPNRRTNKNASAGSANKSRTYLVLNVGSSSIKFSVFAHDAGSRNVHTTTDVVCRVHGSIMRIGQTNSVVSFGTQSYSKHLATHTQAIHELIDILIKQHIHDVHAVVHRVVHGADMFVAPVRLSSGILAKLEQFNELAPLHNPPAIAGIGEAMQLFDHVPHVAVFDTAFHSTIPAHVRAVALPEEFLRGGLIRRYGFHGTSHEYVVRRLAELSGVRVPKHIISTHIGNGISVTGIKHGKSVINSMQFTPSTGPVMGTRTGDIDFGIAHFLHKHEHLSFDEIDALFNKHGGLLGLCGISDIKKIWERRAQDKRCALAIDRLQIDLARLIAGYTADIGAFDALVFTGGAGEAAPWLRQGICAHLGAFGVDIDSNLNETVKEGVISSSKSGVRVFVVPTNEELMMVLHAIELLS